MKAICRLAGVAAWTLGVWIGPAAAEDCPARIRIAFADSAAEPLLNGEGPQFADPPGLSVLWARQALRKLGCLERAELVRLPAARILALAKPGVNQVDLLSGVAEGSPNAVTLVMPPPANARGDNDLSMGQVAFSLFARPGDAGAWDGRKLALQPGQTVGATRGTVSEFLARDQGWPLELAPTYESMFQKFVAGRSAFLFVFDPFMEGRQRAEAPPAERWVKLEPAVLLRRYHMAASQDFFRREAPFVRRLWVELCLQGNAVRDKPLKCQVLPAP